MRQMTPSTRCRQVCTVNPEFVIDARDEAAFAQVLQQADLRVADGVGIVWAARLHGVSLAWSRHWFGRHIPHMRTSCTEGWRVYFLGAAPGVAQRTADALRQSISGVTCRWRLFRQPAACSDWPVIAARSWMSAQPDILLVAFGHPKQNFWIDRPRRLNCLLAWLSA